MESNWVKDRDPTDEEVLDAGDVGFIVCASGERGSWILDHATIMGDCFFEDGKWYISGIHDDKLKVLGWMLPPIWS